MKNLNDTRRCLFEKLNKIDEPNEMDETGAHYTEWSKPER